MFARMPFTAVIADLTRNLCHSERSEESYFFYTLPNQVSPEASNFLSGATKGHQKAPFSAGLLIHFGYSHGGTPYVKDSSRRSE